MADEKEKNTTQDEANRQKDAKERASKSATEVQERVAKAYDHEDPTPTQEENDAAKVAAGGGGDLVPPGDSGWVEGDTQHYAEGTKKKQSEAEKPAGGNYQTRTATPQQHPATPPKAS